MRPSVKTTCKHVSCAFCCCFRPHHSEHRQVSLGDVSVQRWRHEEIHLGAVHTWGDPCVPEQGKRGQLHGQLDPNEKMASRRDNLPIFVPLSPVGWVDVAAVRAPHHQCHSVCGGVCQTHCRLHGSVPERSDNLAESRSVYSPLMFTEK